MEFVRAAQSDLDRICEITEQAKTQLKAMGLDPNATYQFGDTKLSGATLMNIGIAIPQLVRQYDSFQFHLKKI